MSSPANKRAVGLAIGIVAAALLVGAAYALSVWTKHQSSNLKGSLAAGYATQPLTAPFKPTGESWDNASQTWRITYNAAVPVSDAVADAKSQLSKGAYQVDARRPDAIAADSSSATLYRDLITEDVALAVKIAPNPGVNGQTPPTLVTVTLNAMRQ